MAYFLLFCIIVNNILTIIYIHFLDGDLAAVAAVQPVNRPTTYFFIKQLEFHFLMASDISSNQFNKQR